MLKGTTKSGFRYEITNERLNNFELVEILSEVDENPLLLPKMLNLLLGERQSKKLKNYLRDEEGLVSTDKIRETVEDIFDKQQKVKN
ncbi:hypothetical protein [Lactococcus garvieae]|uniref:Phage protein n=1 Tax=Lactococcus garvieae DCC43 TaxID=1231377 RepID=K2PTU9_9LACT|nr:hypothetical protein [Lactococcus garvieae]EKF50906.1 hypothetical protein C426_1729 [Lactococcus garvieae DCC43]